MPELPLEEDIAEVIAGCDKHHLRPNVTLEELQGWLRLAKEMCRALELARELVMRAFDMGHHRPAFAETDSDLASLDAQWKELLKQAHEEAEQ